MKNVNIHILKADPMLSPLARSIELSIKDIVKQISKYIPVENVDILVAHDPKGSSFDGVKAKAMGKYLVTIAINTKNATFMNNMKSSIFPIVAQELFLIARAQRGSISKKLLNECLKKACRHTRSWQTYITSFYSFSPTTSKILCQCLCPISLS